MTASRMNPRDDTLESWRTPGKPHGLIYRIFHLLWALTLLAGTISPVPLAQASESQTGRVATSAQPAAPDTGRATGSVPNTATAGYLIYLPLIMKPEPVSPGDELIVSWAQTYDGGMRTVLLHWHTPPHINVGIASPLFTLALQSYAVDRRVVGSTTWQALGHTGFAAGVAEMQDILGPDLMQQLGYDLGEVSGSPLTPQEVYDYLRNNPATALILSQAYYKVGLATGTSFLDQDAPNGVELEYKVRDLGPLGRQFEPARVPVDDPSIQPGFNLRETWEGPAGLGQAPSPRPETAAERYSWQTTSRYMPWDGKVYLIWDVPENMPGPKGEVEDARLGMNIAGYRVFRSEHGLDTWSSVNPKKARCVNAGLCEMLLGTSPQPTDSAFPPHLFADDLHDSADPAEVYNTWDYKVCAIDALGNHAECSDVLSVDVRELQPPIAVQDVTATVPADQSRVTVTWIYSDAMELSPPLRFYVTRSPTLTAPLDEWTVISPTGSLNDYTEIPNTGPTKKSVTDIPPLNQVFWYRVQVRDDAGNWSAPGTAVKAARYTRIAPNLAAIHYDPTNCNKNPIPFTLSSLDDTVFLINLYRSFDSRGPFELVERFEVTQQATGNWVEISDNFLPPYPTFAYYRLEAVDDHGNVSTAIRYCAQLGDGPLMDPGLPIVSTDTECKPEQGCTYTSSVGGSTAGSIPIGIEMTLPGEEGVPITVTKTVTDSYTMDVNGGAWVNLRSSYDYGEPTISNTITTYEHVLENEFLDTDRNLNGLGSVFSARWLTDTLTTPDTYSVRVTIAAADSPTPPLAIFRRAEGGNWMQISPVTNLPHHYFDDRSDPSPDEQYQYLVMVLSPTSRELLGFWSPVTVAPLDPAPRIAKLTGGIGHPDPISLLCDKDPVTGGPTTIDLHNGWQLTSVTYWIALDSDSDCPENSRTEGFDYSHAYGAGTLTNGSDIWPGVEFQDIAISDLDQHTGGEIVATLAETRTPADMFEIFVNDVRFTASDVEAEVELALPDRVKADVPGYDRTDAVFGVFPQLQTSFRFGPLDLKDGVVLVDENLPWKLFSGTSAWIDEATIDLGTGMTTTFRFEGSHSPPRPDSNLAFMRPGYQSNDAELTSDGLTGTFATGEDIEYTTSFPAGFVVTSQGAGIVIEDSQIKSGDLHKAQASLTYDPIRTVTDYAVYNRYCNGRSRSRYSLCGGFLGTVGTVMRTLVMTPDHVGDPIKIGINGYLSATVTVDEPAQWPSFWTDPALATLFIAPAALPDEDTSWAPMPAEAAWQRLPDPTTGGTFDPGLNLNSDDDTIYYSFYDPPDFRGSAMNLYVRKGGVSGHIIMEDRRPRTNGWGYSENVQRVELQFLDNVILAPPAEFTTDLVLPYPTDATLPMTVTVTDTSNRPIAGVFRTDPMDVNHRYWSFEETPSAWAYAIAGPVDYTIVATGVLTRILQLQDSVATVPGLQPADANPDTAPVDLLFNSEWLPDGDIGTLRILEPVNLDYRTGSFRFIMSAVRLSRYYSAIFDHDSDPSTLDIDQDNMMDSFAEKMLDGEGNLTPESLSACAIKTVDGCGLVVLDGDIGVDYFGEIKRGPSAVRQAVDATIPAVDEVVGEFPLAVNVTLSVMKFAGVLSGRVPWVWPVLNQVLDVDLPVKFLGNTQGGVLVALARDQSIFPDTELFRADVAGVVDIRWSGSSFDDKVGIFLGYGAGQAAFRALAQNRPAWSGGIQDYDRWHQVSGAVQIWSEKFGYIRQPGERDDPVDLAQEIWDDWCKGFEGDVCNERIPYNDVFDVLEPLLKSLDGTDAYGVTGVEAGAALQASNVNMGTGTLTAVLSHNGLGLELTQLEGGTQMQWNIWDYTTEWQNIDWVEIDFFIRAKWLSFEMDRDGEIEVFGDTYTNLLYDWGVDAYVHALATPVGDEWRFEGFVDAEPIGIAGLSALELDGTYGSGPYLVPGTGAIEYVSYFGGNVEAYFLDYRVGVGFLYGVVPQESAILREAGFGEIMDTLGDQGSYAGIYAYIFVDIPLAGDSCLLKATAGGEVRFWYYWSAGTWGGTLAGYVHATVACIISARGQLELGYARLDNGGQMYNRTCESGHCDIYGGSFWVATGVGWCSPSTWHRWADRWWGDSWCYTFGAYVDLSYMDPGGIDYSYDLDYE